MKASRRTRAKRVSTLQRTRTILSGEAQVAYREIRQGVRSLEGAIAEIQREVHKAERKIEAEARVRIRELRRDARAQLGILQSRRRDAARTLKSLSAAADESWQEIKRTADSILGDAKTTATSVIERFRSALGG